MNHSLEYWKKRCELAEKILSAWELDHGPSSVVEDWYNFKNSAKAAIEPDEPETLQEISADMNELLVKLQEKCESMKSWAKEVSERYLKFNKGTKWPD